MFLFIRFLFVRRSSSRTSGIVPTPTYPIQSIHQGISNLSNSLQELLISDEIDPALEMAMSSPYKPSPLSYGSPNRAFPFRRPESPASPSPRPLRQSTPSPSPTMMKSAASRTYQESENRTFRGLPQSPREADNNALSKLQPAQVRELREGFQLLDRDSDGLVGREDIVDMLTQLGLPSGTSDISPFFPPGSSQSINLPTYLNSIATLLASLSPPTELTSAFAAFDEDDSGQVDLAELRDALLNTAPDAGEQPLTAREVDTVMNKYTSRRAFGRSMAGMGKRGEVFKYQEFVSSLAGGSNNAKDGKENE